MAGPARKHHYVPKFLLRPWLLEVRQQSVLRGAYWHFRRDVFRVKERGLDSFCFQIDLLSTKAAGLPPDRYETGFFSDVDTKGAIIRDMLLRGDIKVFRLNSVASGQECYSRWTSVAQPTFQRFASDFRGWFENSTKTPRYWTS